MTTATNPFGFMKLVLGSGLGGRCIPSDPQNMCWKLRTPNYTARFIELSTEVNPPMIKYRVGKIQDALNRAGRPVRGSRILVLGVAYKRNVNDLRESPALDIMTLLMEKGGILSYPDTHVPALVHQGRSKKSVPDLKQALDAADCVVIATDHSDNDWPAVHSRAALLVDTRATGR